MADISKLKGRRYTLGAPPPPTEASPNLEAPEVAPATSAEPIPGSPLSGSSTATMNGPVQAIRGGATDGGRLDGRSARRTGRTLQFATRVSPDFDQRLRAIAAREGILLVEVLERALDAYESR